jgi:transcriptional regulator with PAS, ATPase and Fis domain
VHHVIQMDLIDRVAASELAVVLVGADGATRRSVAARLHRRSGRASAPFLLIDCAGAGPDLEAALFGRAATYGGGWPGILERAHGGTVLLDRIDEVSAAIQTKLVRVLEERQVVRVGGRTARAIDIRMIVASPSDLARSVECGRMRADLYYRLDGITLTVPEPP